MKTKSLVLAFLITSLCFGQDDYEKERIIRKKNKIFEIHNYGYSLDLKDSVLFEKNYCDTNGLIIKVEFLDEKGNIEWPTRHYDYDIYNLTERTYSLSKSGDTSNVKLWQTGENRSSHAKIKISETGDTTFTQKWLYNEQGKDTALINQDKWGNKEIAYITKYDTLGRVISSTDFKYDGSVEKVSVAEYDTRGNLTAWYDIVDGKNMLSVAYEFDNKNQMIHRRFANEGEFYIPNSFNSNIGETDIEETDVIISYKWDTNGNMIEQSRSENGKTIDMVRFFFIKQVPNKK